jgi:threonine/homoserine/homoserine lactone efflux protein
MTAPPIWEWHAVLALLMAALVVMGSPGPSTVSATAMGAAYGIRRSLRYVLGLIAGTTVVLLAVATGVVAMIVAVPQLARALTIAAALYILYLAWKIATAPPLAEQSSTIATPAFTGGFLLAVANPKAYIAIAAVFAASDALAPIAKITLLAAMIVLIHLAWLLAGVSLANLLRDPLLSRIINILLAVALVALTALSLAN